MTDQPDTVQHEGEYWLTVETCGDTKEYSLHTGEPKMTPGGCWYVPYGPEAAIVLIDADELAPLTHPEKPVRVRLELRAVRVEEESDGE